MDRFEQVRQRVRGKKILVANRGITARRIIRSIREELQAVPVVTVTDVDKTAPFTQGARELILLGENPGAYLEIDRILELAKAAEVAAIHPGWGFASEDSHFPERCKEQGILFIGPPTRAMQLLGNKVRVRELARGLGIPVVPGSLTAVEMDEARTMAMELGLPVMLKAEGGAGAGGSTRCMPKRIWRPPLPRRPCWPRHPLATQGSTWKSFSLRCAILRSR
jgi:pyruvate carboxylase